MNLVGADLVATNGALEARFGDHRLRVDDALIDARPALRQFVDKRLILGVRPEDLEDAAGTDGAPEDRRIAAVVDIREDMGSEVFVHFGVGAPPVRGQDVQAAVGAEAVEATAEQVRKHGSLFVARLGRGTRAREQDRIELLVTPDRLHFFDPATGRGIYD
jgi:multiple sugar transport system ATP-binding protein